jgi:GntR family transcriptional regulator / MocR family aminotransferase
LIKIIQCYILALFLKCCFPLEQQVLTNFINEGHLESHVRKMRSRYEQRRRVLVQELSQQFGDRVKIFGKKAGIHLW